jgi:hypothetical protein
MKKTITFEIECNGELCNSDNFYFCQFFDIGAFACRVFSRNMTLPPDKLKPLEMDSKDRAARHPKCLELAKDAPIEIKPEPTKVRWCDYYDGGYCLSAFPPGEKDHSGSVRCIAPEIHSDSTNKELENCACSSFEFNDG